MRSAPIFEAPSIIAATGSTNTDVRIPLFLNSEIISNYTAAGDVFVILRIDSLNSGSIYLGLTFKKIIVGPAIGNMKEVLEKTDAYSFNPENIDSLVNALEEALKTDKDKYQVNLEAMYPKNIAKKWDELFANLKA